MPKFRLTPAACAAAALALSLLSPSSEAQETGAELWGKGGCFTCHGNLGAGDGDAAYPAGPNLRRTQLDRAQLIEVISCGRPGTEMPMHLIGAYTEIACYGIPTGEKLEDVKGEGILTAEEIETLVDFMEEHMVGQRRITRDNCAMFFGGNRDAPACRQY